MRPSLQVDQVVCFDRINGFLNDASPGLLIPPADQNVEFHDSLAIPVAHLAGRRAELVGVKLSSVCPLIVLNLVPAPDAAYRLQRCETFGSLHGKAKETLPLGRLLRVGSLQLNTLLPGFILGALRAHNAVGGGDEQLKAGMLIEQRVSQLFA